MQRSKVRKAWGTAIAVSLLVHVMIFAVLVRDWSARLPTFREDPIEVALVRPEPPPSDAQRPPPAPLPPVRAPAALAPSSVAPLVAPIAEPSAAASPARPAVPTAPGRAPDEALAKLAPPDPRRKDCNQATIAELFGPRLRECEYVIEGARAKSAILLLDVHGLRGCPATAWTPGPWPSSTRARRCATAWSPIPRADA